MIALWEARSPRERLLLLDALVLAISLIANLLVVSPLRQARADAFANLSVSSRTLDALSVALPDVSSEEGSRAAAVLPAEQLRSRLVDIATEKGISVSRLQTGQDGEIVIHFDSATAPLIFSWLSQAENETGAKPQHVSIFSGQDGAVRASFEFRGGGSR